MVDLTSLIRRWLRIHEGERLPKRLRVESDMGRRVYRILQAQAPQVAALETDAPWDNPLQAAIKQALQSEFPTPGDFAYAHDLVCGVIRRGRDMGLWSHAPWPRLRRAKPARSQLKQRMVPLLGQRTARSAILIQHLPTLRASNDANVLAGALLVAAADLSAILQRDLLVQVIDRTRPVLRHGDLVWMDFALGAAPVENNDHEEKKSGRKPWRNVRRWIIDDVSLLLIARYREVAKRTPDAERALAAYCKFIDSPAISIGTLLHSAHAEWSTRIPGWLLTYAAQPQIAVSLPEHAWARLLSGRPLPDGLAPLAPRQLATQMARRNQMLARLRPNAAAAGGTVPLDRQWKAVGTLTQLLRPDPRTPQLTAEGLRRGLDTWDQLWGDIGGWPALMRNWVEDILLIQKKDPWTKGDHWVRPPGLLRYLDGFGKRWIKHLHDLPPQEAFDDKTRLTVRLEALAEDIAGMTTAEVAHVGLSQFLQYVADVGGPRLRVRRDGSVIDSPRDADANLLAPLEYERMLKALSATKDPYVRARARCIAILAYRVGPRWTELQTRQLRDLQVLPQPEGQWDAMLKIRENSHFTGKTQSAERKVRLSHRLSPAELEEVRGFVATASRLNGRARPARDFLFADPDDLHSPPRAELTHDLIQETMRQVSGDPTLVYHSLRHGAANGCLIQLFLEQESNPEALAWMPGADLLTAKGLGYEGAWMTVVTGRPADHPSRLHVISQLLGHLGPDAALRNYLHLVDVVFAREVNAQIAIPDEVAATLEGAQQDSIRRRRDRGSPLLHRCLEQARATFPEFGALWGHAKPPRRA